MWGMTSLLPAIMAQQCAAFVCTQRNQIAMPRNIMNGPVKRKTSRIPSVALIKLPISGPTMEPDWLAVVYSPNTRARKFAGVRLTSIALTAGLAPTKKRPNKNCSTAKPKIDSGKYCSRLKKPAPKKASAMTKKYPCFCP